MTSPKPERPKCPKCGAAAGENPCGDTEAPDGHLTCLECGREWLATDAEIAQVLEAERRIAAVAEFALCEGCAATIGPDADGIGSKEWCVEGIHCFDCCACDADCPTCTGHGIGRTGDPDTSRCGDCGGTGVKRAERGERDFDAE